MCLANKETTCSHSIKLSLVPLQMNWLLSILHFFILSYLFRPLKQNKTKVDFMTSINNTFKSLDRYLDIFLGNVAIHNKKNPHFCCSFITDDLFLFSSATGCCVLKSADVKHCWISFVAEQMQLLVADWRSFVLSDEEQHCSFWWALLISCNRRPSCYSPGPYFKKFWTACQQFPASCNNIQHSH